MKKRPPLTDLATHAFAYVTPPELAAYLECDARTIRRMIDDGALLAIRVGRDWRIPISEARLKFHVEPEEMNAFIGKSRPRGRRVVDARANDKKQARRRVNYLVRIGLLPRPQLRPCVDCGHDGLDLVHHRVHHYDHHRGYAPEHHEDVVVRCSTCHAHHDRRTSRGIAQHLQHTDKAKQIVVTDL